MFRKYFQLSLYWPAHLFLKKAFKIKINGLDKLMNLDKPLIVISNHASYFDFLIIGYIIAHNKNLLPIRFATFYIYYYLLFPIVVLGGSFPVRAGVGIARTLKKGIDVLEKGKGSIMIFPEGKVRKKGRPRKARRGAAYMALKTNTPLLPIVLEGIHGLSLKNVIRRDRQVVAHIGDIFYLDQGKYNLEYKSHLNDASEIVNKQIRIDN